MPVVQPIRAQTPVTNLEESRLTGSWFEIARLPDKKQKLCASDSMRLITRWEKPGTLEWVTSCTQKNHYNDSNTSWARPIPKRKKQEETTGPGRYKVFTIWPFSRKYDVLAIANDNSWMLLGSPNKKSLWVYSKSRTMSPEVYSAVQQVATQQGYDATKLIQQPQNAPGSTGITEVASAP